jgi:outer membrane protein OmpA-like peptidoglycan-associated protein
MKKLAVSMVAVAVLLACGSALAYEPRVWDDLSWWGNSGATPAPYKDAVRSGYWWWPTQPASNAGDAELWGNRGVVYAQWEPPAPPAPPAKPPEPPKPPKKTREIPQFNHVLFDFDKSVLKAEGKAESDKVVELMQKHKKDTLLIEGHTCSVGTDEYNMGLGQRRANSVQKYVVEAGVDAGRVTTKSFGETQPAVPNDTPANRKLNRRAVFKITLGD